MNQINFPKLCYLMIFLSLGFFSLCNVTFAHEIARSTLGEEITKSSVSMVTLAGILIILLVILAISRVKDDDTNPSPENSQWLLKTVLFSLIVFIVLGTTFYLSASTIYLNIISETRGPVHWHADFRIFNCGKEVFFKEPKGLSNRIGTPELHEHGDGRIHVEGVGVKMSDMSLANFFAVIGGMLNTKEIAFPGKDGDEWMIDGKECKVGTPEYSNGAPARLQAFLYKTEGDTITQEKLNNTMGDFSDYVLSGHSQIPPGDCIIFEYSPIVQDKTDKICNFTKIAVDKGEYKYKK